VEAATQSAAVVRQILDFARQHASVPYTPIALAPVVEEALALTRAQWKDAAERQGASITIHAALADLPPVPGQAAELREALVQLIGNAVEAMPTGGTLTITGRPVSSWVELTVTDTGVGIPAELQPRIFDPFFTTKGVQRTGLGLAVVYGTVQRHGGTITVASTPGQGTTFTLRLPADVAVQPAAPPAPGPPRAGVTPRRLLVIDDEPKVRGTLASLLRAVGHTVAEAASGPAGLALLGTIPVDCVLTDLGMPEMTGWEVVKAVNASWPHLPVLLLTGWGDQAADVPPGHRVARVLSKPIRREPLLVVIAEVTGGR
jgi:CheY-like chemotaxis protein